MARRVAATLRVRPFPRIPAGALPQPLRRRRVAIAAVAVAVATAGVAGHLLGHRSPPPPPAHAPAQPADAAFRTGLQQVVGDLNAARRKERDDLALAIGRRGQAAAAAALARTHRASAAALGRLRGPRDAVAPLEAALRRVAGGYDRLAAAARRSDDKAFSAAARAIAGDEARLAARLRGTGA